MSRAEMALLDIINAYEAITAANGYRNDVVAVIKSIRNPDKVTSFPEIGIEMGTERIEPMDQGWVIFNSFIPVYVNAVVSCDTDGTVDSLNLYEAMESMKHDLKVCTAGIFKSMINSSNDKWNISPNTRKVEFFPVMNLGEKRNKAVVATMFEIQIRFQNSAFDDSSDLTNEAGNNITNEAGKQIISG